jgi:hypothetical protein
VAGCWAALIVLLITNGPLFLCMPIIDDADWLDRVRVGAVGRCIARKANREPADIPD